MANPCAGSTAPSLGTRSRTWPYEARTVKSLPRYLLIVLALAGDSTMRRFLAMGQQLPVQGWGRAVNGRPGWRLDGNARGGATGAGGTPYYLVEACGTGRCQVFTPCRRSGGSGPRAPRSNPRNRPPARIPATPASPPGPGPRSRRG